MHHHRAIAIVFAVHGAVSGSLATRLPWIQDHLGLTPGMLGFALLCAPIGSFVGMPMASRLAYRIGARTAVRLLLALWCAGLALPALAPVQVALFGAFVLYGATAGMCDVVMNGHAVSLERRLDKSIMSGLHGMWCLGSLAAGGVGVLAAHNGVDARLHLGGAALVLLGLGALAGRGLWDEPPAPGATAPRRYALPPRSILLVGLVGFAGTFAEGSSADWAAVYVTDVAGAGPGLAAATYTVFMLCMASARLAGDLLVRRFGPVAVVRGGGVMAVLGGAVVVASRSPVLCTAGFALIGLGVAAVVPLVFAAAGNRGTTPGEGVAGVATITYMSALIAPAVTGWVAGATSYPVAFAVITCVVALMTVLAGAMRPPAPAAPADAASLKEVGA